MTEPCTKERELGTMTAKLDNIQKGQDKNSAKIDLVLAKIELLPGMFVLRKEFEDFKKARLESDKNIKSKIWDITLKLAPWIALIFYLGLRQYIG
jgi:hypothetical protein